MGPMLALFIILFTLFIIGGIALGGPTYHSQILTLLGTLAGSVAGYYFKGQHIAQRPLTQRIPKAKTPTAL